MTDSTSESPKHGHAELPSSHQELVRHMRDGHGEDLLTASTGTLMDRHETLHPRSSQPLTTVIQDLKMEPSLPSAPARAQPVGAPAPAPVAQPAAGTKTRAATATTTPATDEPLSHFDTWSFGPEPGGERAKGGSNDTRTLIRRIKDFWKGGVF